MNPEKIRDEDCKCVIKSCRNLVQTEIRTLRDDISSLRGFLHGCQDTINSETAKLEKKCLTKIESLENERLRLERDLNKVKDDYAHLETLKHKSDDSVKHLQSEIFKSEKDRSEVNTRITSLEAQILTKTELCRELRSNLEEAKMRVLALENKLASNEAYVQQQKEVLHEIVSDQKHLETSATDLKLRVAESDVYEKALEGHISELEAICSILREQHDEQQKYFLQKETSFKRDARERYTALETENKRLSDQILCIKADLENEKLKYFQQTEFLNKVEKQLKKKEEVVENLMGKVDSAKNDTQVERSTVAMLTQKNHDLMQEVLQRQSKLNHLEEKLSNAPSSDEKKSIDRKALTEIGNTVQQYLEGNVSMTKKLENSLLASNDDKMEECERQLAFERRRRLSAEMEAANLSVELEKARVELAVYRCNSSRYRNGNFYNHRKKLQNSDVIPLNSDTTENKCNGEGPCNQQYSELLSTLPVTANTVSDSSNEAQLSKDSCNDLNIPSSISNGERNVEFAIETSSNHSEASSTEFGRPRTEISVSRRASEKMKEATRKAFEMLNNP